MMKMLKYAVDIATLAIIYFAWLRPRWKRQGKAVLGGKYADVPVYVRRAVCYADACYNIAAILF